MATARARRARIERLLRTDPRYQFGQRPAPRLIPEGNACGAAGIQVYHRLKFPGKPRISMDDVVKAAGASSSSLRNRGLYFWEMVRAANHFGLDLEERRDLKAIEIIQIVRDLGPVIFVADYEDWPEWKGFRYFGTVADGRPNGYAKPHGEAGKTQLTGFDGQHYGIIATAQYHTPSKSWELTLRDSNHNSIVRPEEPAYDTVNRTQFQRLYNAGAAGTVLKKPWALIPTKEIWS